MPKNQIDFKEISKSALNHVDSLLAEWLPSGKYKGSEFFALNPLRADKSLGSFSVNTKKGVWADYATGDAGGDLISLYAYLFTQGNQGEAAKALSERLNVGGFVVPEKQHWDGSPKVGQTNNREDWQPVVPFDEDKLNFLKGSTAFFYCSKNRKIDRQAVYRDENGKPVMVVQRFISKDGSKSDLPFAWCRNSKGEFQWRNRRTAYPMPIYGLTELVSNPNKRVLIVEGEKCKDVASACGLLHDFVVISWHGGVNGWKHSDWSVLKNRDVLLWADADAQREKLSKQERADGISPEDKPFIDYFEQAGMKAMQGIAQKLLEQGCTTTLVRVLAPEQVPFSGYDIADLLGEYGDSETEKMQLSLLLNAYLNENTIPFNQTKTTLELERDVNLHDFNWEMPTDKETLSPEKESVDEEKNHAPDVKGRGKRQKMQRNDAVITQGLADGVEYLLENYTRIGSKFKAFNNITGEECTFGHLAKLFGENVVIAWLRHSKIKTLSVVAAEVEIKRLKINQHEQLDGFGGMLNRYVYLEGTTQAFDRGLEKVVDLAAVKSGFPENYDLWMRSESRLICPITNYIFHPAMPRGVYQSDENSVYVDSINSFKGLPIEVEEPDYLIPDDWSLDTIKKQFPDCQNIVGLIQHLCSGNGDLADQSAEWVLNWLACRYRSPEEKPATAIVFISETQGVGKSTFAERIIKGLFGEYCRQLDQNALESRFNAALQFALITVFEEISPSDERMNIIGKLKNMITTDAVMVERKGQDAERFDDFNSFVILSNDERAIPIESNDRRFMVSNCRKRFSDEQFYALDEELKNGGLEAFAFLLKSLPLKYTNADGKRVPFTPHARPLLTPIKQRMINLNKPSWEAFLDDWIAGDLGVPYITCCAQDLWAVYKKWCFETKTYSMTQKNFYANIAKRLADKRVLCKMYHDNKRVRLFIVPHESLSADDKKKYPYPTTDISRQDSEYKSFADYYGKQAEQFHTLALSTA